MIFAFCEATHYEKVNYTTKFTWFTDKGGNVIGSVELTDAYSYGVITQLAWENDFRSETKGTAYANIMYADGQIGSDVKVKTVTLFDEAKVKANTAEACTLTTTYGDVNRLAFAAGEKTFGVSTYTVDNGNVKTEKGGIVGTHLFRIETDDDGYALLTEVQWDAYPMSLN